MKLKQFLMFFKDIKDDYDIDINIVDMFDDKIYEPVLTKINNQIYIDIGDEI